MTVMNNKQATELVRRLPETFATLREYLEKLKRDNAELRDQRDEMAAIIGTVRQMLPLPLRNVSDIQPEKHWEEIGAAIDILRSDKERLDWLEASDFWPASLDFWPHHLPQVGGSLRAAIDAARKEEQP